MRHDFYAYMDRMKYIKRWQLMRSTREENIMEHSQSVALLSHALVTIHNDVFGGKADVLKTVLYAMYHETSEVLTGDLPTPIKYYNNSIHGAYKELEKSSRKVKMTAVDISADALSLAKENAEANEAEILFIQSDLFSRIRGRFDIIISNPPYIPSTDIEGLQREVKNYEPRLALDGGADGLDFYRRIAAEAPKYLNRGGMLIMEVGAGQASEVVKMFKGNAYAMIIQDFNGVDRYVKIVL